MQSQPRPLIGPGMKFTLFQLSLILFSSVNSVCYWKLLRHGAFPVINALHKDSHNLNLASSCHDANTSANLHSALVARELPHLSNGKGMLYLIKKTHSLSPT